MMAIVKANYQPRGEASRLHRSVAYYTWREGPDQPRRWYDRDGRELAYDAAVAEVTHEAARAAYTYRLVLSTKETTLGPDSYGEVLGERFDRWYLTTHHGGDHPHAHAIAFSDHRLDVPELAAMRQHLRELELDREHELAQEQSADLSR
jgi:hypothetical protein